MEPTAHPSDQPIQGNRIRFATLVGCLIPAAGLAVMMALYSVNYPYWDDWTFLHGDAEYMRSQFDWEYVFARFGSHVVATLKILYWGICRFGEANLLIGHWLNYLIGCLSFLSLVWVLRRTLPASRWGWIGYPLAAVYSFSLAQWQLYMSAFGSCWLVLPLLLVIGILLVDSRLGSKTLTFCLLLLCGVASITFAGGFGLWVAFPVFLLLRERISWKLRSLNERLAAVLWLLGSFVCLLLLTNSYGGFNKYEESSCFLVSPNDPQVTLLMWCVENPHLTLRFLVSLLGSPAGQGVDGLFGGSEPVWGSWLALINGVLGLGLFAWTLRSLVRNLSHSRLRTQLAPWLTIAVFELVWAGLVTLGRAGRGDYYYLSVTPHYGLIGLQFQFAVMVGAYIAWRDRGQISSPWLRPVLAAVIVLNLSHALGQAGLAKQIMDDAARRTYSKDALFFFRALSPLAWPAPLQLVRPERIEQMDRADALDVADEEELIRLFAEADTRADETAQAEILAIDPLRLRGSVAWSDEARFPPTLLLECELADGAKIKVAVPTKAVGSRLAFDHELTRCRLPVVKIRSVYLFDREAERLIRITKRGLAW